MRATGMPSTFSLYTEYNYAVDQAPTSTYTPPADRMLIIGCETLGAGEQSINIYLSAIASGDVYHNIDHYTPGLMIQNADQRLSITNANAGVARALEIVGRVITS